MKVTVLQLPSTFQMMNGLRNLNVGSTLTKMVTPYQVLNYQYIIKKNIFFLPLILWNVGIRKVKYFIKVSNFFDLMQLSPMLAYCSLIIPPANIVRRGIQELACLSVCLSVWFGRNVPTAWPRKMLPVKPFCTNLHSKSFHPHKYPLTSPSVHLSVCLSKVFILTSTLSLVHPSVCLSVHLSVRPSVCLSVCLSRPTSKSFVRFPSNFVEFKMCELCSIKDFIVH